MVYIASFVQKVFYSMSIIQIMVLVMTSFSLSWTQLANYYMGFLEWIVQGI